MKANSKKAIRDYIYMVRALLFFWMYIPHLIAYFLSSKRTIVKTDMNRLRHQIKIKQKLPYWIVLLMFLHGNPYFRSLFYHRFGPAFELLFGWWRPGSKTFILPFTTKIGKGFWFAHPYSTVLNASSIGDNFSCLHCSTIGTKEGMKAKAGGRPVIGNNVSVGCHVCIIGDITIGDNVTIGAGSVVIKDIPANSIVVGNPARIIKTVDSSES